MTGTFDPYAAWALQKSQTTSGKELAQPVVIRDAFKEGTLDFERTSDPFRTASRQPKPKPKPEVLLSANEEFLKAIRTPLNEGQIKWRNIPLLGAPGSAKTSRAITIAFWIAEFYGWENVNIVISDDLMALASGMRPVPVNILIVDDALRKFQSRGGTTSEQKAAIGKFVELRHELEDVLNGKVTEGGKTEGHIEMKQKGLVVCIFTAQMYKGLEKTFRDGIPVFCSPLTEDKQSVMELFNHKCADTGVAFHRASAAWSYIEKKFYAIDVEGKEAEKRYAIAVLPMMGPCIVEIPWYKSVCMKCKAMDQDRKRGCKECGAPAEMVGFSPEDINPKTKRPYMERVKATPPESENERMRRLNEVYEYVARRFIEAGYNPSEARATALLNVFLRERCAEIATGKIEDDVLRATDWVHLMKRPRAILEHAIRQKREMAMREQKAHQAKMEGEGKTWTDDELVDHVRDEWLRGLSARGFEPTEKNAGNLLHDFIRDKWRNSPSLRARIMTLKKDILAAAQNLHLMGGGRDEERSAGKANEAGAQAEKSGGGRAKEQENAPEVALGMEFKFDIDAYLPKLVDRQVLRERAGGVPEKESRLKWERRVLAYKLNVRDRLGQPHIQREWKTYFGPEALRPWSSVPWGQDACEELGQRTLSNWKTSVESALGDAQGEAYEHWVVRMLRQGWRPSWLKDIAIAKVEHGGGASHAPDVTVRYVNGDVDFVSLKCYSNREYPTLSVKPENEQTHKVDVRPERDAFVRMCKADELHQTRLVIMVRDIHVPGMEVFVAYDAPERLPPKVSFNRQLIGTQTANVWRPPVALPQATAGGPEGRRGAFEVDGVALVFDGDDDAEEGAADEARENEDAEGVEPGAEAGDDPDADDADDGGGADGDE